ncbi:MAG: glycosyltransferase [Frankiaceae bacterium]
MTTTTEGQHAGLDPGTAPPATVEQEAQDRARPRPGAAGCCAVELVVPVHNEQAHLEANIVRLHDYLKASFPFTCRITIADNASTDATWRIAVSLAARIPAVRAVHLDQKGRGRALRTVWSASDAAVLAYMDVDLSTDLAALLPLVAPLLSGHSDVAIGSRLARSSRVVRGRRREFISRSYNVLLRATMRARFSDAQCGFKAIRADCARSLLPLVEDPGWFFDTELLVLAERAGLRIHEVPVDWVDDPDSRVDVLATALGDLRGVARLLRAFAWGSVPVAQLRGQLGRGALEPRVPGVPVSLTLQLVRFAAIGVASTLAYLLLYLALRDLFGAQGANFTALLLTAVAYTAANRRLTFGVRGPEHVARSQVEGLLVFALGLALTSGALAVLHRAVPEPSRAVELAVLIPANLAATLLRFVLFRAWVFHPRRTCPPTPSSLPAPSSQPTLPASSPQPTPSKETVA